ncbi:hypothetical protein LR021_03730 [Candidatus Bipolaricaulota bacterium]|nr:hypothetical protein [Candidatus Bipolaricaulota bacterium]HBR09939.1 hypothetical protein [Candidatus Acetothermia bacterium]
MKTVCVFFALLCAVVGSATMVMGSTTEIELLESRLVDDPTNISLLMQLGELYHSLAVDGERDAVQKADEMFAEILRIDPGNAEALAWRGSIYTLKARDAWFPITKLVYVYRGIGIMRRAVELAPDDIAVRMVRANTSMALPGFFGQLNTAIRDLEHLLALHEEDPEGFSNAVLADIYLALGKAREKAGDDKGARECWQKVISLVPGSDEAKEAMELLQGL